MKNVLIKIALAIGVTGCLYIVGLLTTTDHYWCFKDRDTCTIEEMKYWRDIKDKQLTEENDRHAQQVATINAYYNDQKINPLKDTLSAAAVLKEVKEGDKRNVPSEFFTLRGTLLPKAFADSLPTEQVNTKTLRYQDVLTSVNSPYANVDIESSCTQANVAQYQCDILVAIAQSESSSGNNFKSDKLPREQAIELGQNYYHNPVGIKDLRVETERERRHPDENGMYLRRFGSWEEFWNFYPAHMKAAYFDRGGTTPASISKCYVRGDCVYVKPAWVYRVQSFINKI